MCGLDESYEEQGELAAPQLMMMGAKRILQAGKGNDGIYVGCNAWQILNELKELHQQVAAASIGASNQEAE